MVQHNWGWLHAEVVQVGLDAGQEVAAAEVVLDPDKVLEPHDGHVEEMGHDEEEHDESGLGRGASALVWDLVVFEEVEGLAWGHHAHKGSVAVEVG